MGWRELVHFAYYIDIEISRRLKGRMKEQNKSIKSQHIPHF